MATNRGKKRQPRAGPDKFSLCALEIGDVEGNAAHIESGIFLNGSDGVADPQHLRSGADDTRIENRGLAGRKDLRHDRRYPVTIVSMKHVHREPRLAKREI